MSRTGRGIGKRLVEAVWKNGCWKFTVDGKDCGLCPPEIPPLTPEEMCAAMMAVEPGTFDPTDEFIALSGDTCKKVTLPSICDLMGNVPDQNIVAVSGDKVVVYDGNGGCAIKVLNYTVDINVSNFTYDPATYILTITETDGQTHEVDLRDLLCCTIVNDVTDQPCPDPSPTQPSTIPNPLPTAGSVVVDPFDGCTIYFTLNADGSWKKVEKKDCCVNGVPIPDTNITNYVNANNSTDQIVYFIGNGTAEDPDYVWYITHDGSIINIESPAPTHVTNEVAGPCPSPIPATPPSATGNEIAGATITTAYDDCTLTWTVAADGTWGITANECRKRYAIAKPFCYQGAEPTCLKDTEVSILREDFNTISERDCSVANPDNGLGLFNTDFDLSQNCGPYWSQMYAEGIQMTFAGGSIPTPQPPGVHSNWITYSPYSTGHAGFNLQPSTGVGGQRVLFADVQMQANKCYTFRMSAKDTHTAEYNAANGVALASLGLVVDGALQGATGPITPGTAEDDTNIYEVSFVSTSAGIKEMALISNNAATNGNDIFMDWIELLEADIAIETLEGAHRIELLCDGTPNPNVDPVKVDADCQDIENPEDIIEVPCSTGSGSTEEPFDVPAAAACSTDITDANKYEQVVKGSDGKLYTENDAYVTDRIFASLGNYIYNGAESNNGTPIFAPVALTVTNNTTKVLNMVCAVNLKHGEVFTGGANTVTHDLNYNVAGSQGNLHASFRLYGHSGEAAYGMKGDSGTADFIPFTVAACGGTADITAQNSVRLDAGDGFMTRDRILSVQTSLTVWGGTA